MNNTEANPTLKLPRVLKKLLMKFGINSKVVKDDNL
jgi:hypothetical protein